MSEKILNIPLKEEEIRALRAGDVIYLKGTVFTSRDMGHLRIKEYLEKGQELPVDFKGGVIFHAGPVVKKTETGWDLIVIGPTTSIRMEPYADMVGELGVKAVIGKGGMADKTLEACNRYGYVYLQAAPGCAVKLAEGISSIEDVHWLDIAIPEAMWVLNAEKFGPFVVSMDSHNKSIYKELKENAFEKLDKMYP